MPARCLAARPGLEQPVGARTVGAHRRGPCAAAVLHGRRRCSDPLATTAHCATIRRAADFIVPAPIDSSRLRALNFLALIRTRCGRGRLMWAKMCALISRWNLRYKAADMARAMTLQTTMYQRWQAFFEHHDVILTPAITISPRSWRELYPAEIDGQPTRHLFSLAGIGLRGDASRSSGAVTAGRAGPQRDAVRPANRRTA
jgi:hypothetical protein